MTDAWGGAWGGAWADGVWGGVARSEPAPSIDTSTPGGRRARESAEIARRNEELISIIASIVTSGVLECP